ncbi:hypothetical protein PFISCL1PPCAC_15705, partial [Pristionchus fissidentatus]
LADTTGSIVVRTVARAVVSSEVSRIGDGNTSQMGAHSDDHRPFVLLHSLVIVLRMTEISHRNCLKSGNFGLGAMLDENGLSSPLESLGLTLRN